MEENEVEKNDQPQETNLPEPIETPKDPETEADLTSNLRMDDMDSPQQMGSYSRNFSLT